jgi:hypothetical protein
MVERHWDRIASFRKPENKVSLGSVEGLNNKIRVFHRRASLKATSPTMTHLFRDESLGGPLGIDSTRARHDPATGATLNTSCRSEAKPR